MNPQQALGRTLENGELIRVPVEGELANGYTIVGSDIVVVRKLERPTKPTRPGRPDKPGKPDNPGKPDRPVTR